MDFQDTLFAGGQLPLAECLERVHLSHGAWVDVAHNWASEPDGVFDTLRTEVPWRAESRQMYDRFVAVPRLLHTYLQGEPLPHPDLVRMREQLSAHYAAELHEPFVSAGCCYYRDGNDSVAWHGDTIGRGATHDTMVAILSLGETRKLALRPRGGGSSRYFTMGHGDLVVMGGSCQRTWEHAVPKAARPGPRISVQFRPLGVF